MKRLIIAALVVIPVIAISYWAIECPCDQTPGLYLRGVEAEAKVTNWAFANQVPLCQVQVDTGLLPHALNLNCWADSNGDLYLSCGSCDGKRWSKAAVAPVWHCRWRWVQSSWGSSLPNCRCGAGRHQSDGGSSMLPACSCWRLFLR